MSAITEPQRSTPVIADVDVCVLGGGPGGLPAAIAAARQGARTLLVEMQGFLGGMATAGQIGPILGHHASSSDDIVVEGLVREMCDRMAEMGQAWDWDRAAKFWGIPFNVEGFKIVADRMVQEANVELMLHTLFADAIVADGRMTHAIVESKSGRQAIAARVFIDATGDADVVDRAGGAFTLGRPADGLPMAMGSIFRIGGLEKLSEDAQKAVAERMREGVGLGDLNLYGTGLGGFGSTVHENERTCNMTRFSGNCADVRDLTQAELAIRDLTWRTMEAARSVPGAEDLYLISTPAHVGLRESRQLEGVHRITGDDVVSARKYEDGIARCGYWIDIHCPRGLVNSGNVHLCSKACSHTDCYMLAEHADELPGELYPPKGDWFDIPYRTLIPCELDGVIVSGRCISADYQAMSAMRVMATCMAIGEAAGIAAAMAASSATEPRAVDVADLRARLVAAGALI